MTEALPESVAERKQIAEAAKALARAAEPLHNQTQRLLCTNLVLPVVQVAAHLRVFEYLSTPVGEAHTTVELAELTKAEPLLLTCILWFLAAHNVIDEPSAGSWAGSAWTQDVANEGNLNGIKHQSENTGPAYIATPNFLRRTSFHNVNDGKLCDFQEGQRTEQGLFAWFSSKPVNLNCFMRWMATHRGELQWTDAHLVQTLSNKSESDNTILFVDVGGNIGNVCVALRTRAPSLRGRVINQDLPHVIVITIDCPGVERSGHDFWTPQVNKGAKVYYLRNILHDWPDAQCLKILRSIMLAMSSGSEIWIDGTVLPDRGATEAQVNQDWTMLSVVAGMERSQNQWSDLLEHVELKVQQIHNINPASARGESIIVARHV